MKWATLAASAPQEVLRRMRRVVREEIVRGHADFLAGQDYHRLLAVEPVLRRSVPTLILLFIVAAAFVRIATLASDHAAITERAGVDLGLLAGETARSLDALGPLLAGLESGAAFEGLVASGLPASAATGGRTVILADARRVILAAVPSQPALVGRSLDDVLGPYQLLSTFGRSAGVVAIETATFGEAIAAARTVVHPLVATVALVQPSAAILAGWRQTVMVEGAFFAVMSGVLGLLGFAYQSQATRAAQADAFQSESETRIHTALTRGRAGLWDWNLDRDTVFWSASMCELVGLQSRARLMTVAELGSHIHPDDDNVFARASSFPEGNLEPLDREFRVRHRDGHYIWVRAVGEIGRDASGALRMTGIMTDVTEKRRLARLTRRADARLREAIETISEAFVLWDSTNRLVICNDKYKELYGLDRTQLAPGTPYEDIRSSSRRPIVASRIAAHPEFPGGRTLEAELEDGRWLQINERRTKDGGFVSVGTDITTLKRHEQQLMESERELTATVDDLMRSRALLEEQTRRLQTQTELLQAQRVELEVQAQRLVETAESFNVERERAEAERERAEQASRAKSAFLASVSHELRTPLNAIIGFSEMMMSGIFGELGHARYREYCKDIHNSGNFLLEIIGDILEMARIDAGRLQVRPEKLDAVQVIGEAARFFSDRASKAGLDIAIDVADGMALMADPRACRQILFNLVSNAVKFTPQGGRVLICCEMTGDEALLSVSDTGIGIPAHAIERLGRPFEQVENELTRSHTGSGLGLAITRSLVELHGGTLTIRSEAGTGTTVMATLPAAPLVPSSIEPLVPSSLEGTRLAVEASRVLH